ncbi:BGTF surface domain-containing protein [Halorientalis brevis]|uniref:BGTF surface domain-containing protein n=1 Tax=Halorientalis brevis TaxID=1126241 RepID=A0ABD6C862_9EURY|nr:BGTF surface domain-containing protein [Halorientalis brevis]
MTASLTGTAAATNAPLEVAGNDLPSSAIYLGQELEVGVTGSSNQDFEVDDGETVFFYELLDGDDIRLIDTETVENGEITLDTATLDDGGQFAINNRSSDEAYQTEFGILEQEFDAEWSQETVTETDEAVALEISSNRDPAYNVTISADGLDYDELNATFIHPGTGLTEVTDPSHLPLDRLGFDRDEGDGLRELRNSGYITLNLSTSTRFANEEEIVANFTNVDAEEGLAAGEEYEFEIFVTDTTASDNVTLQTGETTAEFDQELYTRAAGDLAEFSVSLGATDEAWVQFVDPDSNFVDVLYLSDDDNDGEVTFTANTRLVGTDHASVSGLSDDDTDVVYHSSGDTVTSHIHDEAIANRGTAVTSATFYDETVADENELTFSEYVEDVNGNSPTAQLSRPLQPTDYDLVVANNGRFVAEDGEPTVDDEIGSAEFDLVQPSIRDVHTWAAPRGQADEESTVADLSPDLTARDEIALGDRAVVQFNATGLVGAMATIDYVENGNDITDGLEEGFPPNVLHELAVGETAWEGEGIHFSFEGEKLVNRDRNEIALAGASDSDAYVLVDQQTAEDNVGVVNVVVDTDAEPFDDGLQDGERFETGLLYDAAGSAFSFDGAGPLGGQNGDETNPAYPYFPDGFRENVTEAAAITFGEPTVRFANTDGEGDDETVQLAPDTDALVSGTTNVAPGSEAMVSVRLTPPDQQLPEEDPSFLARQQVDVEDDGSFSTELDLGSRVVGEEGYVQFQVGEETIDTYDVVFRNVSQVEEPYFDVTVDAPAQTAYNATFDVSATVTNTGDSAGTGELAIAVDGDTAVRGVFDLDRGESETLTQELTADRTAIEIVARSQDTVANRTISVLGDDVATEQNGTDATTNGTVTTTPAESSPAATPDEQPDSGTPTEQRTGQEERGLIGFVPDYVFGAGVITLAGGGIVLFRRWNTV